GLDWHDYETGKPISRKFRLETIRTTLDSVPYRVPRDMTDDGGDPLHRDSIGPLYPRKVEDGRRYALTAAHSDFQHAADPAELLKGGAAEGIFAIDGPDPELAKRAAKNDETVRLCIRLCGIVAIAKRMKLTPRSVRRWVDGSRALPRDRALLDRAIAKLLD